jgi:hypothetical protein
MTLSRDSKTNLNKGLVSKTLHIPVECSSAKTLSYARQVGCGPAPSIDFGNRLLQRMQGPYVSRRQKPNEPHVPHPQGTKQRAEEKEK